MDAKLRLARRALLAGAWACEEQVGSVALTWEQRCRRRFRQSIDSAWDVLVDLPRAVRLAQGDGLLLDGGGVLRIIAACERVLELRAGMTTLIHLAYHLGNRHTAIEISGDALIVMDDRIIGEMVRRLGGEATPAMRPFHPEPGAYEDHR